MSNETVTLTRETYHELMDSDETLKAFQNGLPVLVSGRKVYDNNLHYYKQEKAYEVLYDGDEPLKEMVKKTSAEYLEYKEKFHRKAGALMSVERSLKSSVKFTWFWFFMSIVVTGIHFIK